MAVAQAERPRAAPAQLTPLGSVLASAASACSAVTITNIPETIKTRLQLDGEGASRGAVGRQYAGITDAFAKIWRQEGVRGLQSGLGAGMAYQFVMNGTRLGLYEPVQRGLASATGWQEGAASLKVAAAATSGALGAVLGSPLYLIKSRLQAQSAYFAAAESHRYSGLLDGLAQVWRAEGARGLLRGVDGALPRVMVGSATQLTTYDVAKEAVARWGWLPPGAPQFFAASLMASVVTVTVMNPLDVISTRLYQSAGRATVYTGPLDCALKTVRAEGVAALQKGWLAQYARLGPHTILTFLALEQLKPVVGRAGPPFSVAASGGSGAAWRGGRLAPEASEKR